MTTMYKKGLTTERSPWPTIKESAHPNEIPQIRSDGFPTIVQFKLEFIQRR